MARPRTLDDLLLRVTNRTGQDIWFMQAADLKVIVKNAQGKVLPDMGGQKGAVVPRPLFIKAGATESVRFSVTLHRPGDGESATLTIREPTAYFHEFQNLAPGAYSIEVIYANREARMGTMVRGIKDQQGLSEDTPLWVGQVTTKDLALQITDAPVDAGGNTGQAGREKANPAATLVVQAQILREIQQEPAEKDKPEPWITAEAVNLTNGDAGHRPPAHLEVQTDWTTLGDQPRVLLQGPGGRYSAGARRGEGTSVGEFNVTVGMQWGDARGELLRSLEAKAGARKVLEISSARTYLALRVVKSAPSDTRETSGEAVFSGLVYYRVGDEFLVGMGYSTPRPVEQVEFDKQRLGYLGPEGNHVKFRVKASGFADFKVRFSGGSSEGTADILPPPEQDDEPRPANIKVT